MPWTLLSDVLPVAGQSAQLLIKQAEPEEGVSTWPTTVVVTAQFSGGEFIDFVGMGYSLTNGSILAYRLFEEPTQEEVGNILTQIYGPEVLG